MLHAALLLLAAQVLQPADVPAPATVAEPTAAEIAAETAGEPVSPDDAAAIAARRRLNTEMKARTDAADAGYAAAQAAYQAQMREHAATVESTARAQAEYQAARAAYDQRQREIADWRACVDGDKDALPAEAGKIANLALHVD